MYCWARRARISDSGTYWSIRPTPMSPIGITSISVSPMPLPCAHSISEGISSSFMSFQGNGVDLDRKARRTRRFDAGQNLIQITPAGDGAELGGIERIQRHVDAADAAIGEFVGKTGELRPVGRKRQFVKRAGAEMARQ